MVVFRLQPLIDDALMGGMLVYDNVVFLLDMDALSLSAAMAEALSFFNLYLHR